jgi:hypothetical protein
MRGFGTTREAKDYLSGQIAVEAGREGVELNEIERKMLYFSESGWTLPNMLKVNEEFERDYDNGKYELKIAGLIRGIESRQDRTQDETDAWKDAVRRLSGEDHYLLVLIDLASRKSSESDPRSRWLPALNPRGSKRRKGDNFRLVAAAFIVCAILPALVALRATILR